MIAATSEVRVHRNPESMHVLTLTPFYPTAVDDARGCFIAEGIPWLQMAGIDVDVIAVQSIYRAGSGGGSPAAPAQWVNYLSLPGGIGLASAGAFLFAKLLPMARRMHQARRIDLIHAHAPLPCGHAAMLLGRELGIGYLVSVHGLDAFSTNQVHGRFGQWCERVSRMVYHAAEGVACVSDRVRQEVVQRAPRAQTAVVYNGVDAERFTPPEELGDEHIVLSVGDLIPTKGHATLLRAAASIRENVANLKVRIVGDGRERNRLVNLARELGVEDRVTFLGRQSRRQVVDEMRNCTVFALPSHYEALGCVYLEAMACGKPAIGCRGQGIEEVIRHGFSGILVDPGDAAGLAQAMIELLRNSEKRGEMGREARNEIVRRFTLRQQAEALARIYRECLAK